MTTLNFVRICTKPFEHRPTTKVELDDKGRLRRPDVQATADDVADAQSGASVTQKIRQNKHLSRLMSAEQELLYGSNIKCGPYDSVTQFGLRPAKMLDLFPIFVYVLCFRARPNYQKVVRIDPGVILFFFETKS